jgi:amidase
MTTWTMRFDEPADGRVRVGVKDAMDVRGVPTWSGCVALRETATAATADAACLAGVRAAGAAIVGKTNQTELCLSPTGINKAFGTPVNPLAPDRVPGGSSSGSAVAVATGEVDVGLGTDTGGSVRMPAACCGVAGLKTTWGRIPTAGVWPLSPSLDTVGPIARDVAGVIVGMRLLEPGFTPAAQPARTIGRFRVVDADPELADAVDPAVEDAVDRALAASGLTVHSVVLPGWVASFDAFSSILLAEFWRANGHLLDQPGVGEGVLRSLRRGREVTAEQFEQGLAGQRVWQDELAQLLATVDVIALPTLVGPPPRLTEAREFPMTELTAPFNVSGSPALALPVPTPDQPVPLSLQLVGPIGGEELLCATGLVVAAALR